jgi:alkylhydroperoxidase family enzyme
VKAPLLGSHGVSFGLHKVELLLDGTCREAARFGLPPDEVTALAKTPLSAGLSEEEQAIVDYATRIAGDPASVDESDIARLRDAGLSDIGTERRAV